MQNPLAKVYVLNLAEDDPVAPKLAAMKLDHAEFTSIDSLLLSVDLASRGCVLANLNHFGIGGMDVLQHLNQRQSTLPLILLARRVSTRLVVRVMREGAMTLIEKPVDEDELFFAIREAFEENERRFRQHCELESIKSKFAAITSTELQVLDAICTGKTNKQIAESLGISVRTVEARKKRVLNKTECGSQPELIIAYHTFITSASLSAAGHGLLSTPVGMSSSRSMPTSASADFELLGKSA